MPARPWYVSHLQFNGWGGKQVHTNDQAIAVDVARRLGMPVVDSGLIGEAGGAEQDGHGLLMAHESSWVNDNRNPGQSRDQIEQRLRAAELRCVVCTSSLDLGVDFSPVEQVVQIGSADSALSTAAASALKKHEFGC